MDPLSLGAAIAVGSVVGTLTGLVPGVHVNTVCAVALAGVAGLGPLAALGLAAMAVAHAFSAHLPATYLGAPGEETMLSALPAHRMLLEGHGPEAVQVGLDGALAGLAAATLLVLPYKWLLGEPIGMLDRIDAAMPWILSGVVIALVARERRLGWRAMAWAAAILALSGALGVLGSRLSVRALVPVATTTLLPMLSGLFGAPALLETLRAQPLVPEQDPVTRPPAAVRTRCRAGVASGVLAAAATAVLPGLTSAVAAALARSGQTESDARPVLATLSAIATAHLVLTFVVLWLSSRARTGVAVATAQLWRIEPWAAGAAPLPVRWLLLACLAGGLLGHLLASIAGRPAARFLPRLPQRLVAGGALVMVTCMVVAFSGPWGAFLFVVAAAVGLLPLAAGLGRVHLTGSLLVPVLLRQFGWA